MRPPKGPMKEQELSISSNWASLDRRRLISGFAWFLTGALSDGTFVIVPTRRRRKQRGRASLDTDVWYGKLASAKMTTKGAYAQATRVSLRSGELRRPEA